MACFEAADSSLTFDVSDKEELGEVGTLALFVVALVAVAEKIEGA